MQQIAINIEKINKYMVIFEFCQVRKKTCSDVKIERFKIFIYS